MADEVRYDQRGRIALITLNRPGYANAQNSAMTYALDAAIARAVNDDQVAVGVRPDRGRRGRVLRRPGAAHTPAEPLPSPDTAEGFARHREWERELTAAARRLSRAGGRSVRNIDQKCRGGYWTPVHKCPTVLS